MVRRNPYRPGTPSYAAFRQSELNRRQALAEATAGRSKKPEARKRAQRRASAARRELQTIEKREQYLAQLSDGERQLLRTKRIRDQDIYIATTLKYPGGFVPPGDPDPFETSPSRNQLWNLLYSARRGIRPLASAAG